MRTCRGVAAAVAVYPVRKVSRDSGVLRTHIERPDAGLVSAASSTPAGASIPVRLWPRPRTHVAYGSDPRVARRGAEYRLRVKAVGALGMSRPSTWCPSGGRVAHPMNVRFSSAVGVEEPEELFAWMTKRLPSLTAGIVPFSTPAVTVRGSTPRAVLPPRG